MIARSDFALFKGRHIVAALFALLISACGQQAANTVAQPAMWMVEDEDTRIYLLGSMHALPETTDWDDGKVEEAIAGSNELILELSPAEVNDVPAQFLALAPRDRPR